MKYVLYCGLAVPAISLLAWLFVRDYRGGSVSLKQTPSRLRLVSIALLLFLTVVDLCAGLPETSGGSALMNLQMAGVILLLSPHSFEGNSGHGPFVFACVFASVCLLTALAAAIAGAPGWKGRLFPLLTVSALTVHNWLCVKRRFSNVRALFQNRAVWHYIEDYASHCYAILLLSSVCLAELSFISQDLYSQMMLVPSFALLSVSVYGAYRKSVDASVVFLSERQRLQIEHTMEGNVVERSDLVKARMEAMFARIEKHMTEHKPYLEEGFSLGDLADAMLSNRVSVSKAINNVTGHNFSRLVNGYRVAYSQKLWRLNPGLRLKEMYSRCGFHNMPSFINAFKKITGCTPIEWLKEIQVERLRDKSPAGKMAA